MMRVFSTHYVQYAQASFSTAIKKSTVKERTESQKKKIPYRSSFFPVESLTRKELKQLNEGVKAIERFNERLARAKQNFNKD